METKCREFICSRKGVSRITWGFALLIVILMATLVAPVDEFCEQLTYVISSFVISIAVTVTIFARYAWLEHFPVSAILNIGCTFVLSFF